VGALGGLVWIRLERDPIHGGAEDLARPLERLRVGDTYVRLFRAQLLADLNGGGFSRVARICLEGEAEYCDALAGERVEHDPDHSTDEPLLLVLIQRHDCFPVSSDFR